MVFCAHAQAVAPAAESVIMEDAEYVCTLPVTKVSRLSGRNLRPAQFI
jgi:hypothetical protein